MNENLEVIIDCVESTRLFQEKLVCAVWVPPDLKMVRHISKQHNGKAYDGQEPNPSNGSSPNPALRLSAHQNDVGDDQRRGLAS